MVIRKIVNNDIESISRLHKKVFDKSYFSVYFNLADLDKYFVKLIESNNYNYLCKEDKQVLGYLIGGFKTQGAVDAFMKENKLRIFLYIFLNPKFIWITLYKLFKKIISKNLKSKANLRLFLIGVDPQAGKRGIGSLLIERFEKDIQIDGFNEYGLYVRTNNQKAINFYLKLGFIMEYKSFDLFSFIKKTK